ncbi:ABC transporter permease subunit [Halorussus sp. MSC15.2]|uniref:ABC transporter permease subunit n=1 Tax=Halorussus sp. MSC15.2 TaxID=2283638 RepID=UPI0013D61C67|nr:ABC transporter permease subunit [Halorussus sp. MSC15.2]NEU58559.1 ABC transporter permease [Halorussus sp. MSC15.2]
MSVRLILRQDLLALRRTKLVWAVLLFCPLLVFGGFYAVVSNQTGTNQTVLLGLLGIVFPILVFVPMLSLVVSAFSIAKEREQGNIRFLLSFPNDRREVVLGKFCSRSLLTAGGLLVGFVLATLLSVFLTGTLNIGMFLTFSVLTLLLMTSYVSIATGISATVTTQSRAIVASIGAYLVWNVFWIPAVPNSIPSLLEQHFGLSNSSLILLRMGSPSNAYLQSIQYVSPRTEKLVETMSAGSELGSPLVAVSMLIVWSVLPLVLGYWQFQKADIS